MPLHRRRRNLLSPKVRAIGVIYALLATLLVPAIVGGQESAPAERPGELTYTEKEPADRVGKNDEPDAGELIAGLGTGPGDVPLARVIGEIGLPLPAPDAGGSNEDDGSFELANVVDIESGAQALLRGEIGDGPHAETGDYDHYAIYLDQGQTLHARTDTTALEDGVDTIIVLFDPDGDEVDTNDDIASSNLDSEIVHTASDSGVHVLSVGGCCLPQVDPEDPASGAGAGAIGPYTLVLGLDTESEEMIVIPEEDDGSFDLATLLPPPPSRSVIEAYLGDGPFGDSTGDIDTYALGDLDRGTTVVADIDSATLPSTDRDGDGSDDDNDDGDVADDGLDSLVVLWDEDGVPVDWSDDDGASTDSLLISEIPEDGEFFLSVISFGMDFDPMDSGSGSGAETTGPYRLTVDLGLGDATTDGDVDVYLVDLDVGDVLSAGFAGTIGLVEIIDPNGVVRMSSFFNPSTIYPAQSPLRHLGEVGVDHVAGHSGHHAVVVYGDEGRYRGEIRVAAADPSPVKIFLDFDGATLNRNVFDGPDGEFTVSPLSSFLFRWDLGPEAESTVIDGIVETTRENVSTIGGHPTGAIVSDSRDGEPAPGEEFMRIVVGGTIFESDIETIGIAESIDPGNLVRNETGLVLLDSLSGNSFDRSSLNRVELAEDATIEELIGLGIGNVVSHEIGHLIGLWHTEVFNKNYSLMDRGGDLDGLVGIGPDAIFGTKDDVDVDFVPDAFEEFGGYEDVATRARIGLGGWADEPTDVVEEPADEVVAPDPADEAPPADDTEPVDDAEPGSAPGKPVDDGADPSTNGKDDASLPEADG